jgi:hypothetical protein
MRRKDSLGRTWHYNDCEGTWEHGKHVIGCGGKNKSRFMVWTGPNRGTCEYTTLAEAMTACLEE